MKNRWSYHLQVSTRSYLQTVGFGPLLWIIFVPCVCVLGKKMKKELKRILTTFCVQQKYNIYLTRYNIANNIYIINYYYIHLRYNINMIIWFHNKIGYIIIDVMHIILSTYSKSLKQLWSFKTIIYFQGTTQAKHDWINILISIKLKKKN